MAKSKKATGPRSARPRSRAEGGRRVALGSVRLERDNLLIMAGALVSIVLGYVLLAYGSMTAAPALLVLGYCFLIPFSLFWRPRASGGDSAGPRGRDSAAPDRGNSSRGE